MRKRFNDAEIATMVQMKKEGMKLKDIAAEFHTSQSTVSVHIADEISADVDWESKKGWPEWDEWRILHEKYGGGRYKKVNTA